MLPLLFSRSGSHLLIYLSRMQFCLCRAVPHFFLMRHRFGAGPAPLLSGIPAYASEKNAFSGTKPRAYLAVRGFFVLCQPCASAEAEGDRENR